MKETRFMLKKDGCVSYYLSEKEYEEFVEILKRAKTKELEKALIVLSDTFGIDETADIVKEELRKLMYHDLPKIKPIFMDSLGIDIGVIKDLCKAVLIRHDIVHRNGKDKEGKEHVITKENVEQLCALVNDFIYNIECQLPPTATSVEEIGSPFDVTL